VRSQLMEAFKECGEISAVRLPTDRETGDLKGIGFVEFATPGGKVRARRLPGPRSKARPACRLPRCMRARGARWRAARRRLRRSWTAPRPPAGTSRWTPTSAAVAAAAAAAAAAAGLAAAAALAAAGAAAGAGALMAAAAAAAAALAAAAAAASTGAAVRPPADLPCDLRWPGSRHARVLLAPALCAARLGPTHVLRRTCGRAGRGRGGRDGGGRGRGGGRDFKPKMRIEVGGGGGQNKKQTFDD